MGGGKCKRKANFFFSLRVFPSKWGFRSENSSCWRSHAALNRVLRSVTEEAPAISLRCANFIGPRVSHRKKELYWALALVAAAEPRREYFIRRSWLPSGLNAMTAGGVRRFLHEFHAAPIGVACEKYIGVRRDFYMNKGTLA
ncbi:hypothetical protein TcCL_NonESM00550 [Trypanosoma cruzi]|nr:hypothetical protein TcCL_NonESM00550 [Trypanosoma cruzi]